MNGTNGGATSALQTSGLSSGDALVDDLIRRALRVGDPSNPREIAQALLRRYPDAAVKLNDERSGFSTGVTPTLFRAEMQPGGGGGESAGEREYTRVRGDLEADLGSLIEAPGNREWKPELTGWRSALLREFADGAGAARRAQDPARRERAFFAVRRLGEYARLARLVGLMNFELNASYRRLATTLDGAASVLRVLMGEALYDAGLGQGGIIIQVPLTDLRQRRDALMASLRRLTGVGGDDSGDGDWGEDAAAYGQLLGAVEAASAPELKVYLRPEMLGPILDGLVGAVSRDDPEALRQVAATAPVEINRLNRLYLLGFAQVTAALQAKSANPQLTVSPGLSSFVQALKLLLDAFLQSRAGARLVDLAVPLPMAAQGLRDLDRTTRNVLRDLVNLRGALSAEVECFLNCCGCERDELKTQVKLDKVLYDVDRAIDLYAQGHGYGPDQWGDEEERAAVYGIVAGNLAGDRAAIADHVALPLLTTAAQAALQLLGGIADLAGFLAPVDAGLDDVRAYCNDVRAALEETLEATGIEEGEEQALAEARLRPVGKPIPDPKQTTLDKAYSEAVNGFYTTVEQQKQPKSGTNLAVLLGLEVIQTVVGSLNGVKISHTAPETPPIKNGLAQDALGLIQGSLNANPEAVAAYEALGASRTAILGAVAALADDAAVTTNTMRDVARSKGQDALGQARKLEGLLATATGARAMLLSARSASAAAAKAAIAAGSLGRDDAAEPVAVWDALHRIDTLLGPPLAVLSTQERLTLVTSVFSEMLRAEEDWRTLVGSLAPRCLGPGRAELVMAARELLHGSQPDFRFMEADPIAPTPVPPATRIGVDRIVNEIEKVRGDGAGTAQGGGAAGGGQGGGTAGGQGGGTGTGGSGSGGGAGHPGGAGGGGYVRGSSGSTSAGSTAAGATDWTVADVEELARHLGMVQAFLHDPYHPVLTSVWDHRPGAPALKERPTPAVRWNALMDGLKTGFASGKAQPRAPAGQGQPEPAPPETVLPLDRYDGVVTVPDGHYFVGWVEVVLGCTGGDTATFFLFDAVFGNDLGDPAFREIKAAQLRQAIQLLNALARKTR